MNPILLVLNRSIAGVFFRQLAGFFLFLFFILFGIYPNIGQVIEVHSGLIRGILTTPSNFLGALLVWFLYALKIMHFFYRSSRRDSYLFLQQLNALESRLRKLYLLQLALLMFSPVLAYTLIILVVSVAQGHLPGGLAVGLSVTGICVLMTYSFYQSLQLSKAGTGRFLRYIPSIQLPRNLFSFLLQFVFREQFVVLAVMKTVGFSILYFFIATDPDSYKDRILWLLFITCLGGHGFFIHKMHSFMETRLRFYRNMPVRGFVILIQLLALYLLLLVPELWALKGIAIQHHAYADYAVLAALAPCMALLMHVLLYTADYGLEDFLKMLFGIWVLFFFFGLSAYRWVMPPLSLGVSFLIFYGAYYRYEKKVTVDSFE